MSQERTQTAGSSGDAEWVSFPGGELEGKRPSVPSVICPACRATRRHPELLAAQDEDGRGPRLSRGTRTICFQCYRAGLERERALRAARELDTASEARFQFLLPFERVDRSRLAILKAERFDARAKAALGSGRLADRRRHAQMAARRALHVIAQRLNACDFSPAERLERERAVFSAVHAAELQLPESWLPFVVSR